MEGVDDLNAELARLLSAKQGRRRSLAALPFPEKVRAVIRLQEMAAPILKAKGRSVRPWRIDPV
jgi:hypothetical protein